MGCLWCYSCKFVNRFVRVFLSSTKCLPSSFHKNKRNIVIILSTLIFLSILRLIDLQIIKQWESDNKMSSASHVSIRLFPLKMFNGQKTSRWNGSFFSYVSTTETQYTNSAYKSLSEYIRTNSIAPTPVILIFYTINSNSALIEASCPTIQREIFP